MCLGVRAGLRVQKQMLGKLTAVCSQPMLLALVACGGMLWAGQSSPAAERSDSVSETVVEAPRAPCVLDSADSPLARLAGHDRRQRYTAFFIDEYHLSTAETEQVREAVNHYSAKPLSSGDRVGLFSASGELGSEFTDGLRKLTENLTLLRSQNRFQKGGYCPDITPYYAQRILEESDLEALQLGVALTFLCRCRCPTSVDTVLSTAMLISIHSDIASGNTLKALENLVGRMEGLPGSSTLIIVSDGFQRGTHQDEVDAIVHRAQRQGISISAFVPRRACNPTPIGDDLNSGQSLAPSAAAAAERMTQRSHNADAEVLMEFAAGTGGAFTDNSTDDLSSGYLHAESSSSR